MAHKLRRGVLAALAIAGVYAAYFVGTAGFAELNLFLLAEIKMDIFGISVLLFCVFMLTVLSNILPCLVLQRLGFRTIGPFLLTGTISGAAAGFLALFGRFCFFPERACPGR